MLEKLHQNLLDAGQHPHILPLPDGTRLLTLAEGGRVLGLFGPSSPGNFYWTNPELDDAASARALFGREGWHNTGGDRTWLAPEVDIFFPDFPDTNRHWEPPQLDAEKYTMREMNGGVELSHRMTLHFARSNADVSLNLGKWVGAAPHPLRNEQVRGASNVEYAGYTQHTWLRLGADSQDLPILAGIWNLLQVPHGGEMIIATYAPSEPLVMFGGIPSTHLIADDRCVRFKASIPGEHKIAVRAAAVTGRIAYAYPSGDGWALIVRNFFPNLSGEYIDVPFEDPDDVGYAVQAVNVQSDLGEFCELEYHAPAIGKETGQVECMDVSQVWAFRGTQEDIDAVAKTLLGAGIQ